MIRVAALVWLMAVSLAAGTLFHTSYEVGDLRQELARINGEIVSEQIAIRVLRAEWAYLNSPDRLRTMTRNLTTLTAVEPIQMIASVADLPVPLPTVNDGEAPVFVPEGLPMAGLRVPPHKPPARAGRPSGPIPHIDHPERPVMTAAATTAPAPSAGPPPGHLPASATAPSGLAHGVDSIDLLVAQILASETHAVEVAAP